jgi:hypothetical protein
MPPSLHHSAPSTPTRHHRDGSVGSIKTNVGSISAGTPTKQLNRSNGSFVAPAAVIARGPAPINTSGGMVVPSSISALFKNDPDAPDHYEGTFDQLLGKIYLVAKDQQGCRYLQKRLEEQIPREVQSIFTEVFEHITELMTGECVLFFVSLLMFVSFSFSFFAIYYRKKILLATICVKSWLSIAATSNARRSFVVWRPISLRYRRTCTARVRCRR